MAKKSIEEILETEFNKDFVELMKNRMTISYHKYGPVISNYGSCNVDAIKSLEKRLKKYEETGNVEWLVDVANFAMIEYMCPQHKNAHFKGTDSNESPGLVGTHVRDIQKRFKNRRM